MFGIRFLRCPTFRDGRRTARPDLNHELQRVVTFLLVMDPLKAEETAHGDVKSEFFAEFSLATGGG